MSLSEIIKNISDIYILYFISVNIFYFLLNYSSMIYTFIVIRWKDIHDLPQSFHGFNMGVSILIPSYNEENGILDCINAVLNLEYPQYEVIVINDGSKDNTLTTLILNFELVRFDAEAPLLLPAKPITDIYRSKKYPKLLVLNKQNGGKSDALNAGISYTNYPLFCCIDADSILARDSLKKTVQPFLDHPNTVGVGGMVCIADGCKIEHGFLRSIGLPKNYLSLIQVIEYWRAFIFSRAGWTPLNTVPIISGAFSLFKKQTLLDVGGYSTSTVGEDMEIVLRIHYYMRRHRIKYRIIFITDPICWTKSPQTIRSLGRQRMRWQKGLFESLWANKGLLFYTRGGLLSWFTIPCIIVFDALEPFIQLFGQLLLFLGFCLGVYSIDAYLYFTTFVILFSLLLSINAILIEEISIHSYNYFNQFIKLFGACILENFGFHQINTWWRFKAFFLWIFKIPINWRNYESTKST